MPKESSINSILDNLQEDLNKAFGDDSVMRLDSQEALSRVDHWVSTRSIIVDAILRGGRPTGSSLMPFGRQVEISGPNGCLDGNTFIPYTTHNSNGKKINHKGGTIEHLYNIFNKSKTGVYYTTTCMKDDGCFFSNQVAGVVKTGTKTCFEVTTITGYKIEATEDHKFWVGTRFVKLKHLQVGDVVYVHNGTRYTPDCSVSKRTRFFVYIKNHPYARRKRISAVVNRNTGEKKSYYYSVIPRSRASVEASLNALSLEQYVDRLNSSNYEGMTFLDPNTDVHHLDEDTTNDDVSNLVVMSPSEHTALHCKDKPNNLRYVAVEDTIKSIKCVGVKSTYDIKMESPFNNYVANGFVVHNSGKSTLCAQIAAETQSKGGIVITVDTEERIDTEYWTKLGVDVSTILRIQAGSVDDVFNKQYTALNLLKSKAPEKLVLMVWDSLGGTRPLDMVDDKAKETPMEQAEKFAMRQAKRISQGMELINGVVASTRACYLYTNHEYTKMGVTYGSARETRGGEKPRYLATVRLQLTPIGHIYEEDVVTGQKQVIGNKVQVKALKNSMAGILMTREAVVMANKGFVNEYAVFDIATRLGLIVKSGSWSKFKGAEKEYSFQGFNGFMDVVVPTKDYESLFSDVVSQL
jgi:RecA/RadA recombinase